MLKRLRGLEISLAAKCQLLFGFAVVLIIAAALAVPWYRFEELTDQLNDGPATVLGQNALAQHELAQSKFSRMVDATTRPSTRMASAVTGDPAGFVMPKLIGLSSAKERTDLTNFERRAAMHFLHQSSNRPYVDYYHDELGRWRFLHVRPVHIWPNQSCAACHTAAAQVNGGSDVFGILSVDMPTRVDSNQLLRNRLFIVTAGFLAGTLAIIVFYLISTRLILQPVRVLQETADKVSKGDLNIRSDINTGDEFQQLSDTFNIMLANLKDNADQLRSINKALDVKLGQLAETNVSLFESNRLKSEFLANVSHELRTPLNSILGFADLLKDSLAAGPDSKSARYVNNILQSSRHLLELINDLLDLAKIEAGRMEVRSEPLSMPDLFEGLTNILKPLTEQRKLTVNAAVSPQVPIIRSDPGKLQQILYNFLANAIKFSPVGGAIDISALLDTDGNVRIEVTDQGPGIDPAKQQMIFEKFRQADASVTRTHSGTGLGLAISKELTSLLSGSIGVQSVPGQGATFWLVVPVAIEAGATDVRGRLVLS